MWQEVKNIENGGKEYCKRNRVSEGGAHPSEKVHYNKTSTCNDGTKQLAVLPSDVRT